MTIKKKTWLAYLVIGFCILSIAFIYGCGSNATGGGSEGGGGGAATHVLSLQYALNIIISPDPSFGTVQKSGTSPYNAGTVVTLTAEANTGYIFDHWGGSLSGTKNPTRLTMNGPKNVTAVFRLIKHYALNIAITPAAGGTVDQSGTSPYEERTVVSLTAEANTGYIFNHWGGSLSGTQNPARLTMNGPKNVTAMFRLIRQYALNVAITPPAGGTVGQSGTSPYEEGTVVTLTPAPNTGYYFANWGGSLSGSANPATITMNGNKNVTAVFKAPQIIPGGSSIYDGTYMGHFAYVYYVYGGQDPVTHLDIWNAQPTSFQLTVTLKHLGGAGGVMALQITHVTCSDTHFGTGVGGYTPVFGTAMAALPTSIPTTPFNPSTAGEGLVINLPNGSFIGTTNTAGALNVTSNGRILSNTVAFYGDSWLATLGGVSPTFPPLVPGDPLGRPVTEFNSWSLTK